MGSYGEGVAQLQVRLNALGYDCQRTDGVFDDVTRQAVLLFQQTNRLSADGLQAAKRLRACMPTMRGVLLMRRLRSHRSPLNSLLPPRKHR